jgi:hypothetical protein
MDSKCEAFELGCCVVGLIDENEFERELKVHLPLAARYVMRSRKIEGLELAAYFLLVWLGEAQLRSEVVDWLAKVVVYAGGNKDEVIEHTKYPTENQTAKEFVYERYTVLVAGKTLSTCRGNLSKEDVRLVDEKKCVNDGSIPGSVVFGGERPEGVGVPIPEVGRAGEPAVEEESSSDECDCDELAYEEDRCRGCGSVDCDRVVYGGFSCPTHDDD